MEAVYIITTLVALLFSYVIIRFAVKHGTASALQEHEVWKQDGGLQKAIDARARKLEFDAQTNVAVRNEMRAERGEQ